MANYEYKTIRQLIEDSNYPFTLGQLRHYLIQRHRNGLEEAVRKIGKRIFIRVDLFDAWIEKQGGV